ncbi:hypothetical protein BM92_11495 [Haloferax mediterranei ATCC 33500]|uniref:Uncharacterized protein n=1 Tax=Haloferax mediterranei (strain ATCC 33500 / DSM 1411 / JCM 8866 / NBRC 14739 / NCIMB 2177 / R-4) TaxID=523841 RepID=A0A059TSQ1_HALMT|nr:hypothetical protein BM92_11495 [Haloferax mediterranei ATCC 33500]
MTERLFLIFGEFTSFTQRFVSVRVMRLLVMNNQPFRINLLFCSYRSFINIFCRNISVEIQLWCIVFDIV